MSASRTLYILDSVAAARSLRARRMAGSEAVLLSLHCSVVDFLAARGVSCRDFSEFISADEVRAAIRDASTEIDAVLARLDGTLGARMCAVAGMPRMALFHSLFKYLGQYHLAGLSCFERVLGSRLAQGDVCTVHFLHALGTSTDPVFSFAATAERVCKQHGVGYAEDWVDRGMLSGVTAGVQRLYLLALRALRAPNRVLGKLTRGLSRWRAAQSGGASPAVVLLAPSDHSFFEAALSGCGLRVICLPENGIARRSGVAEQAARTIQEQMTTVAAEWLQMQPADARGLAGRLVSCVIQNSSALLLPLAYEHLALQSRKISAAAWDIPPVSSAHLNLLVELYLCSGVPVLGRQHGANYVDQDFGSIHFDSDFNRCTHFFSYGFGPQEFAATYPTRRARCTAIPAGNPPLRAVRWQRAVDIVFPITNCISLFYLARMPESELTRRQSGILEAMEGRSDLCVVKPPLYFSENDFAHVEALGRLRHVRVARATWADYLARYRPRLVIFETASTPLFEALPIDVDIFLMLDPVFPFADSALAMLRRRVHIFATVDEMTDAIRRYGLECLPSLRDPAFYRTYVNRGSAAAVANLVNELTFAPDCKLPVP